MNCSDLILIANAAEARLLAVPHGTADAGWVVLDALHRGEQRPTRPALRPVGQPPLDPVRRRMREFATQVAQRFEQLRAGRAFGRVVLFAACPFLAELMRQLDPDTKRVLHAVVDADISDLAPPEIARRVRQALDEGDEALRERQARLAASPRRVARHDSPQRHAA